MYAYQFFRLAKLANQFFEWLFLHWGFAEEPVDVDHLDGSVVVLVVVLLAVA